VAVVREGEAMSAAETRPSRYYFQFVAYRLGDIAAGFGALAERISRVSLPVERESYNPFRVQQVVAWGAEFDTHSGAHPPGLEGSARASVWVPYLVRLALPADDERQLVEILRHARDLAAVEDPNERLRDGLQGYLPYMGNPVGEWLVTQLVVDEPTTSSGYLLSTWRAVVRQ
jgi:hypothetical protein